MTSRNIPKVSPINLEAWLRTVRNAQGVPLGVEEFMHALVEARVLNIDRYHSIGQGIASLSQIDDNDEISKIYRRVLGVKEDALVAQTMPLYESCIQALFAKRYPEEFLTQERRPLEIRNQVDKLKILLDQSNLRPDLIETFWGEINAEAVKAANGKIPIENPAVAAYMIQEMLKGKIQLDLRDIEKPVRMIGDIYSIANDDYVTATQSSLVPVASFLRFKSRKRSLVKGVGNIVRAIHRFRENSFKPMDEDEEEFEKFKKIYGIDIDRYKSEGVGLERFWNKHLRYMLSNTAPIRDIIGMTFLYQGGHSPEERRDGVADAFSRIMNHPYITANYDMMQGPFDDYHKPRPGINLHRIKVTLQPRLGIDGLPDRSPIEIIISDMRSYIGEYEFGPESHTGQYGRTRERRKKEAGTSQIIRLDRGRRQDDTAYFSSAFRIEDPAPRPLNHPLLPSCR